MTPREDRWTTTEADAAAWERRYGPTYDDDRPTRAELDADEHTGDDPDRLDLLVGDDAPWGGAA